MLFILSITLYIVGVMKIVGGPVKRPFAIFSQSLAKVIFQEVPHTNPASLPQIVPYKPVCLLIVKTFEYDEPPL